MHLDQNSKCEQEMFPSRVHVPETGRAVLELGDTSIQKAKNG